MLVEREIDLQHIDARLAQEAQGAAGGVVVDDRAHLFFGDATLLRDARNLQIPPTPG